MLRAAGAATAAGTFAELVSDSVAARVPAGPHATQGPFGVDRVDDGDRFPQSVASGGPTPDGVLVWTRLAPDAPGEPVGLTVATDEAFDDVVHRTVIPSDRVGPERDHTVTVDLAGELEPARNYHYRFVQNGVASRTGRCRTLPAPDADVDRLRLGLATCNDYRDGYWGAFRRLAESDLDFLLHLGDLIYESSGEGKYPGRSLELPSDPDIEEAITLDDFRALWKQYRAEPAMQRALEAHTVIVTWDDHEIVNNRYWNYETDAPETTSNPRGDEPEFMRKLYARGIRAWTEYVPARVQYDPQETAADAHEGFRLYRSLRFGNLADLFISDDRLYRSPPPSDELGQRDTATPPSRTADDEGRTMLGEEQFDWLVDGVSESDATWKLWMNSVHAAPFSVGHGPATSPLNYDAWGGYQHERDALMAAFADADNVVSLTGDFHAYMVSYLQTSYDRVSGELPAGDERVGVELMTPAISSGSKAAEGIVPKEASEESLDKVVQANNTHMKWFNVSRWGYCIVELTDDGCLYDAYEVDKGDPGPDPETRLLRRYRVPEGEIELQEMRSLPLSGTVKDALEFHDAEVPPYEGDDSLRELLDEAN